MNFIIFHWVTRITLTFAFTLALVYGGVQAQPSPEQTCAQKADVQLPYERFFTSSVAWSPDGRYLVVIYSQVDEYGVAFQQGLAVFDTTTFDLLENFDRDLINYASPFDTIYWSPSSERFAVANGIIGVEIVEVANWQSQRLPSPASREFVQEMMWSTDGRELAIVSSEPDPEADFRLRLGSTVRIWNVIDDSLQVERQNLEQAFTRHFQGQWYFAIVERGSNQLSVVRLDSLVPIFTLDSVHLVDFSFMDDDLILASVQFDPRKPSNTSLHVWNVETGEQLLEIIGDESLGYYGSLIADTQFLIARPASQVWVARRLDNGESITFRNQGRITLAPNGHYVASVEVDPTGGGSPTVSGTGDIYITDMSTDETIATFSGESTSTLGLAWSPDSLSLAVTGTSGSVSIYSLLDCFSNSP